MLHVLFKNVSGVDEGSRVGDLLLEETPDLPLVLEHKADFLSREVGDAEQCIDEVFLGFVEFAGLAHGYPTVSFGLFLGANPEGDEVLSDIDVRVRDDVDSVLRYDANTNYLSSMVSKKTLWSTPLGRVCRAE